MGQNFSKYTMKFQTKIINKIYINMIFFTNVLNYLYDYENELSVSDDLINLAIPKKKIDKEL